MSNNIKTEIMKAIRKSLTTYERIHTYNDQEEKTTRLLSYMEIDDRGNFVLDQSFNPEDGSRNTIRRRFDGENRVVEEVFIDGEEETPYETRLYTYAEGERIERCDIQYLEDKVCEKYRYDEDGKLLEKEIRYEDGSSYIETRCTWEGMLLVKEEEFSDSDELQLRKEYTYNEKGQPVKIVLYEPEADVSVVNKTTEVLTYGPQGVEMQETYNISDQLVVRRNFSYDAQGRRDSVIIESASSYFRHVYGYDEKGNCILDQMLNKDNVVLNEKHTAFDDKGNEIRIDVYSKNIVDNTDELLLIESYITEYQDI